ncbi:3-keto-steroid reductase [Echria macrotheca]|uniref:3-keto-steroid reductase n=1 Tax=Echria macrotheca TaxID=438768 RepID=A0AAJ0BKX2_9PEZI|nr:3-keto-steroid reductase [Echria macrotheca]
MVSLEQVRSSNGRIASELPPGLVAVFLGGTGAIGGLAMRQFARHTVRPRIYFLGRSQTAGDRIVAELKQINPDGDYCFIRADISLLRTVDDVCREIRAREHHINLLFLTTGTLEAGKHTEEGIELPVAVMYYSRIRFIVNLLPLLQRAPSLRRVVSVLCGSKEGEVDLHNLPGRAMGLMHMRGHFGSMMTLALESLALEAPDVAFIHDFPGSVRTDMGRDVRRASVIMIRIVYKVIGPLVYVSDAEAGDRHLFLSTSARFPPRLVADGDKTAGVTLSDGISVSIGSNGKEGSGVYSVNYDGEPAPQKALDILVRLRSQDVVRKVWQHTEEVFTGATGTAFV